MTPAKGNKRTTKNVKRQDVQPSLFESALKGLVSLIVIYVVFVAVFLVWQELYRGVLAQGWFDVLAIDIVGNERVPNAEILAYGHLSTHRPIFDVNVKKAALQVESHPWIKSARVSRRLPDALLVEVVENQPMARVKLDRMYYVNQEGTPFKFADDSSLEELVLIEGLHNSDFEPLEAGQRKMLRALQLQKKYNEHPMSVLAKLKGIRYHHNGLELLVGDLPSTLVFGQSVQSEALDRAAKLWKSLAQQGQHAETIHLDNRNEPERVTVKYADNVTANSKPTGKQ